MRFSASSSLSKTRALPVKRRPSLPLIFATAPPAARLPRRITRCPSFLTGSFIERMTVWPFGYGFTLVRFCRSVLPVTVRQSPCSSPAFSSVFINGWMPPTATSSLMKWRPLGLRSASTGVRAPRRVKSASVSFTLRMAWAIARRCSTALVEPPSALTTTMAFSKALRVRMSLGRILRFNRLNHRGTRPAAIVFLWLYRSRSAPSCRAGSCRALQWRSPWYLPYTFRRTNPVPESRIASMRSKLTGR